jgi:hypothetical protein
MAAPFEQVAGAIGFEIEIPAQLDRGIEIGARDADLCGRLVQAGFGGANVGTAQGDRRRQAERQIGRAPAASLSCGWSRSDSEPGRSPRSSAIRLICEASCASSAGNCASAKRKSICWRSRSKWFANPPFVRSARIRVRSRKSSMSARAMARSRWALRNEK